MIERALTCLGPHAFHRLAYCEWPGPADAPTLLCVHGLTRNARDFDTLAAALSVQYRVICPDMPGRGKSEWLESGADYDAPLYLSDIAALIARLDVETVDWVGTSMGGNIGMLMAALPHAPIRRLVLNDIGPVIPKEGLKRIADYVGLDPSFADLDAFEAALRFIHAPFGPLSDQQWRDMAVQSARRKPDGSIGFNYDPKIAEPFRKIADADLDLWAQWERIVCPVLVLRGAHSDILRRSDAEAMTQRGPRATLVEFAGIGHAPALLEADQIAVVRDFLLG
ncbi:MAG: alpha/beta fold hydrolase [Stellaceae bacterium]